MVVSPSYRLPQTVRPVRYRIELTPDLAAATFAGRVEINVEVLEEVSNLVLNAAELDFISATVRAADGDAHDASASFNEDLEQATLIVPEPIGPGEATVTIEFTGILNDQLHGFYRSTFVADDATEVVLATTQFESTDARRAFPCWDEPEFKATFALSVIVPEHLTVISSGAEVASIELGDGTKRYTFDETMKMSTYVLAWVVGPFEVTDPVDVNGVPVRLAAVPGRMPMTEFGLEVATHALHWLAEYFGIPYPSDKLDHVAIPDFAFGAMENVGCVTYREVALLADPTTASQAELMRIAQVVSHETAHMWFGDLVTMKWWNGIWLNEAFATFMELKATEAFRPEWEVWTAFAAGKAEALSVDGLKATRPVEIEVGPPEEAEAMFDALTYEKGGSVLRMLEQYLGEETFRAGITRYLNEHLHANTETTDLWDALETASGEPVRATMDSWIFQGGHPLLTVEGEVGASKVTLSQRRFLYTPDPEDTGRWVVPVTLKASVGGEIVRRKALVEGPTEVDFGGPVEWVVANEGAWGFYRTTYSPSLRAAVESIYDHCEPLERVALISNTWAAVLAGSTPLSAWASLVTRLNEETDPDVWLAFAGQVGLLDKIASDADRPTLQAFVRRVAGPAFERIGWDPAAGEPERIGIARGRLVNLLGLVGADEGVRQEAKARFAEAGITPGAVSPDLLTPVTIVTAATGGDEVYAELRSRLKAAKTPADERRYGLGISAVPEAAHLLETMELSLSEEVRTQDGPFYIGFALSNRGFGAEGWSWVEANQERIAARFPRNLLIRLFEGVLAFVDADLAARTHAFFASTELPLHAQRIAQIEERVDVNVAFANRVRGEIGATLA